MLAESLGMSRDIKAEEFDLEDEEKKPEEESPIVTGDDSKTDEKKFDGDDL